MQILRFSCMFFSLSSIFHSIRNLFFRHFFGKKCNKTSKNVSFPVRPIVVIDETNHYELIDDDPFRLNGPEIVAVQGSSINISCPVVAFPAAVYSWKKDDRELSQLFALFYLFYLFFHQRH